LRTIPYVIEKSPEGERSYDIYSRLLKDRIIFLGTDIDDDVANSIVAQLLFLSCDDGKKDISLYINSPGGVITSGLAIIDTMKLITPDIKTICIGQAASMASIILACGTKGKRIILENSRVMIHQPMGGARGQEKDIQIQAKEISRIKFRINNILSEKTGKTLDEIERDTDRDYFMEAEEALAYGIVDKIL